MNNSPLFFRSPLGSTESKVNASYWKTVTDLYDQGLYVDCIKAFLHYLDKELPARTGNPEQTEFNIPHGSIIVNLKINPGSVEIHAPFIRLPENGPSVALLRKVAEINFHPLTMTRIILDENSKQLYFYFKEDISLTEPYKLYDLLKEICINADKYDDLFITKFKASRIREPEIRRFSPEQLEEVWEKVQLFVNEAEEYINFFESKRWNDLLLDIIQLAIMKIDYYIAPQGYVRTEMEEAINGVFSGSPYNDRVHQGKAFLEKIRNYDKNRFLDDIYRIDTFIPYKWRSNLGTIRKNMDAAHKLAAGEIEKNDYTGATLTLLKDFYNLFYYYDVEDSLAKLVSEALNNAGGKTWEEASGILFEAMSVLFDEQKYNEHCSKESSKVLNN